MTSIIDFHIAKRWSKFARANKSWIVIRTVARRVVRLLDTVPFAREAIVPAVFVTLYVLLGQRLHFTGHGAGAEIFGGVVAAVVGYSVAYAVRMRGFRKGVRIIREIADQATLSPGRRLYIRMILDRLIEAKDIVNGFQRDTYTASSPEQLQGWIGTFFELGEGDYAGVDSHLPSQYWSDYAWFLEAHAHSLKQRRENDISADDVRILALDKARLEDEWFNLETLPDYRKFVEWHADNEVELRTISTAELAEIRKEHELETDDDVAFWTKFAVLFTGQSNRADEEVAIKLRVKRDNEATPDYDALRDFMVEVKERSALMKDEAPGVEMGDEALIERWDDYVAPDIRWLEGGVYRQFMENLLKLGEPILDAAAGSGTDSVHLLSMGYSVTSNEVDSRLASRAESFAAKMKVPFSLEFSRWEELTLRGNPRFNSVLVLGNSLCLVLSSQQRKQALESFLGVLRPGGQLIIDERNYEYMRRNRRAILSDPYANWLKSRADVMYPGSRLVGFPSDVEDTRVQWSFAENNPPLARKEEMLKRSHEFHPLELYAFEFGELYEELENSGFHIKTVYGDLKELSSDGRMPSYEETKDSGFLTYVAERPA